MAYLCPIASCIQPHTLTLPNDRTLFKFQPASYFLNSKTLPLTYTYFEEGSTKEKSAINCFFTNDFYLIFAKSASV